MKTQRFRPRALGVSVLLGFIGSLAATPATAGTIAFDGGLIWSQGQPSLNINVVTGTYFYGNANSSTPVNPTAIFSYFNANDQIVTNMSGSSLNFTTPSGGLFDEYSSNVGLGATVGPSSLWGGPGSLYKNGTSQFSSGVEGFLGFSVYDGATRYGYFSLTRDAPTNSWEINGFAIADAPNTSIVTKSISSVPDHGATLGLLGIALSGLACLRRRMPNTLASA
jgi:hypothetical protein